MRKLILLILVAIAGAVFLSLWSPSQGDQHDRVMVMRVATPDSMKVLRQKYLAIKREVRRREYVKAIERDGREVDWAYLERHYGLKQVPPPAFAQVSDPELEIMEREVEREGHTAAMTAGPDDTREIYLEIPAEPNSSIPFVSDSLVLRAARSVVAIIEAQALRDSNGVYKLDTTSVTMDDLDNPLCESERMYGRTKTKLRGTGFLMGDSLIATAGHVVDSPPGEYLKNHRFVFDYVHITEGVPKVEFSQDEVYEGELVIKDNDDEDWAFIRLKRKVVDRVPLKIRKEGKIGDKDRVYVIGHAMGGPQLFSGPAKLAGNTNCERFYSDLDTYPLFSGSPVFNVTDNIVEGIHISSQGLSFSRANCECFMVETLSERHEHSYTAETVRTTAFYRYLDHPDVFLVSCEVQTAFLQTETELVTLHENDVKEFSSGSLMLDEYVELRECDGCCPFRHDPRVGEEWRIVQGERENTIVMEEDCFP